MKRIWWSGLVLAVTLLLAACGKTQPAETPEESIVSSIESAAPAEPVPADETEAVAESVETEEAPVTEETPAEAAEETSEFSFADITGREFDFSSGAGAWGTYLFVEEDGSFAGVYHDSNMGETGPGYNHGTVYYCAFSGKFGALKKINENTYETNIEEISYEDVPGREEIKENILYVYTVPYGLDGGETFRFYLPATRIADLPEEYIDWVRWSIPGYMDNWNSETFTSDLPEDATLDAYGLYNVEAMNGFYSYQTRFSGAEIRQGVTEAETKAKEIEDKMQTDPSLAQIDLNFLAGDLYYLWDGQLNRIWDYLKEEMEEDAFAALRDEQIAWIAEKEAAVEKAGAAYEGGSIQPMIMQTEAARITKERVEVLLQYVAE